MATPPSHPGAVLVAEPEQVKGFALSGGKIVLGGGVGEMLELARANLRNIPAIAER